LRIKGKDILESRISVVIIGLNVEKTIEKCIEPIYDALIDFNKFEILYIDSNSKDNSVKIAQKYNKVKIFVNENKPVTAAASRRLGIILSKGDYILLVDADMELNKSWFNIALEELINDDKLVAVGGLLNEVYYNSKGKVTGYKNNVWELKKELLNKGTGGLGLIKKSIINEVGNFNPYLYSHEEAEFIGRIVDKKYKTKILFINSCTHHTQKRGTLHNFKKTIVSKRILGVGQTLRVSLKNRKLFFWHFKRNFRYFAFLFYILIFLYLFVMMFFNNIFIYSFIGLILLNLLCFLIKNKNIVRAIKNIVSYLIYSMGIVIGFFAYNYNEDELVLQKNNLVRVN